MGGYQSGFDSDGSRTAHWVDEGDLAVPFAGQNCAGG